MTVTEEQLRRAWGTFATGVTIVTTTRENGGVHRMTANALCSVSLSPPLLLLCVGHQRHTYQHLKKSGRFGINVLRLGEEEAATRYAMSGDDGEDLDTMGLRFLDSGTAVLEGALSVMDCRVVSEHVAGDHTIFVAEVEHVETEPGAPLLFFEGRYAALGGE
jgi:flavin reductase (DIM6/NTAB) family NADH-FMN oxidoreductase RutF